MRRDHPQHHILHRLRVHDAKHRAPRAIIRSERPQRPSRQRRPRPSLGPRASSASLFARAALTTAARNRNRPPRVTLDDVPAAPSSPSRARVVAMRVPRVPSQKYNQRNVPRALSLSRVTAHARSLASPRRTDARVRPTPHDAPLVVRLVRSRAPTSLSRARPKSRKRRFLF